MGQLQADTGRAIELIGHNTEGEPSSFSEQFRAATAAYRKLGTVNGCDGLEPNAMIVCTAAPHLTNASLTNDDWPNQRIVLLKGVDERGVEFYTNRKSDKGREIAENSRVAFSLPWVPRERFVTLHGVAESTTDAESNAYWARRPLLARAGSAASKQSQPYSWATRKVDALGWWELRAKVADVLLRDGFRPKRPPHWGGYRMLPERIVENQLFAQTEMAPIGGTVAEADMLIFTVEEGEIWQGSGELHIRGHKRYRFADGQYIRLQP